MCLVHLMTTFIVFFSFFSFSSDSGTTVHDSTEQAQRNKKEACTATNTVTVVRGIPCAYQ